MAEWRFLRTWSAEELVPRLRRASALPRSFSPDELETPGWNFAGSYALVACEIAGPPEPDGPFERLVHAIERFHHSDPRIVVAHFREEGPLVGRTILLELRAVGLRYLCPARIGAARSESDREATLRGFALDTLEGHIERGREWFVLEKDHRSGEVRFRIEADWTEAGFPNGWSHLGFHLVGRHYQRAWHRLAHMRLRRIAAGFDADDRPDAEGVWHEGIAVPTQPIPFIARRASGRRRAAVEREVETMQSHPIGRALALGALSGVRSAGGPALLARALESRGRRALPGRGLRTHLARPLAALAAAELVVDKLPFTPARTAAPSVAARALSGALVGSLSARRRRAALGPALAGAAAAIASTFASFRLRRLALQRSKALGHAVALAEDALVIWAGSRLAEAVAASRR